MVGVANLLKHQSLDISVFRWQPLFVFTPEICMLSGEIANVNCIILWLDLSGDRTRDLSNAMLVC